MTLGRGSMDFDGHAHTGFRRGINTPTLHNFLISFHKLFLSLHVFSLLSLKESSHLSFLFRWPDEFRRISDVVVAGQGRRLHRRSRFFFIFFRPFHSFSSPLLTFQTKILKKDVPRPRSKNKNLYLLCLVLFRFRFCETCGDVVMFVTVFRFWLWDVACLDFVTCCVVVVVWICCCDVLTRICELLLMMRKDVEFLVWRLLPLFLVSRFRSLDFSSRF